MSEENIFLEKLYIRHNKIEYLGLHQIVTICSRNTFHQTASSLKNILNIK